MSAFHFLRNREASMIGKVACTGANLAFLPGPVGGFNSRWIKNSSLGSEDSERSHIGNIIEEESKIYPPDLGKIRPLGMIISTYSEYLLWYEGQHIWKYHSSSFDHSMPSRRIALPWKWTATSSTNRGYEICYYKNNTYGNHYRRISSRGPPRWC